jgi:hypothetical protein
MANIYKDISAFTKKAAASGNEEFQVSATEKVSSQQVADLFKAMEAKLTGFTPIGSGAPTLSASNTILQAFQILYQLVGSARMKVLGSNDSNFGFVAWSGTTCYGIVFQVADEVIYVRDGFTVASPGTQSDGNWISHIKDGKAIPMGSNLKVGIISEAEYTAQQINTNNLSNIVNADIVVVNADGLSMPLMRGLSSDSGVLFFSVGIPTDLSAVTSGDPMQIGSIYIEVNSSTGALTFASFNIFDPNWIKGKTPVTVTDFKSLPNAIKNAEDGEIIPIIAPNSAANGPTGLVSIGPAYGYVQVAKVGSTKAYNFLVQMNGGGNPQLYSGFVHTTANQIYWTPIGGGSTANVLHGENIEEGLEYLIPDNVGDTVAFRITGDSSQVPNSTEGFGLLSKINGSESLLIATQINPNNTFEELLFTGRVQNDGSGTDWHQVGASSSGGMEKLSTWDDQVLAQAKNVHMDSGDVTITLNRAIKSTDMLLITWLLTGDQNSTHRAGNAIIYPNLIDMYASFQVMLDERFINYSGGEFYALNMNNGAEVLVGQSDFSLYLNTAGNVPQLNYSILGVYNISGK